MAILSRISAWLARGDNAFNVMLFTCFPMLVTIVVIGWVGVP